MHLCFLLHFVIQSLMNLLVKMIVLHVHLLFLVWFIHSVIHLNARPQAVSFCSNLGSLLIAIQGHLYKIEHSACKCQSVFVCVCVCVCVCVNMKVSLTLTSWAFLHMTVLYCSYSYCSYVHKDHTNAMSMFVDVFVDVTSSECWALFRVENHHLSMFLCECNIVTHTQMCGTLLFCRSPKAIHADVALTAATD